jgi:hypothetical protein
MNAVVTRVVNALIAGRARTRRENHLLEVHGLKAIAA